MSNIEKEYTTADMDINKAIEYQIKLYPKLSDEEIEYLLYECKNGNFDAKEALVNHHLSYVRAIVNKNYKTTKSKFSDAYQYGCEALSRAIDKFIIIMKPVDDSLAKGFRTYIKKTIMQATTRYYIQYDKFIRVPEVRYRKLKEIKAEVSELIKDYTVEEISEILKVSEDDIRDSLKIDTDVTSLNTPIGDDEENELMDVIPDDVEIEEKALNSSLYDQLCVLLDKAGLDKEQQLIVKTYLLIKKTESDKTLDDIGKMLGTSKQNIQSRLNNAIKKIRLCEYTKEFAGLSSYSKSHDLNNLLIFNDFYKNHKETYDKARMGAIIGIQYGQVMDENGIVYRLSI